MIAYRSLGLMPLGPAMERLPTALESLDGAVENGI